jgi:hypothetical protein
MIDKGCGDPIITFGSHASAGSASNDKLQATPLLADATAQRAFAAAGDQFNALRRFASVGGAQGLSIEERAKATRQRMHEFETAFVRLGAIEVDAHGSLRDEIKYARAVEAIQAKALALGYGAQSTAVPITSVPGGYVGRYEGHDIYAATSSI